MARESKTKRTKRINSTLWHALAAVGKNTARPYRDYLPPGSSTPVELRVEGMIDDTPVAAAFSGKLNVGHDDSQRALAVDSKHLLAYLIEQLDPKTWQAARKKLEQFFSDYRAEKPATWDKSKALPVVREDSTAAAEALLNVLKHDFEKRGAVSFKVGECSSSNAA